jgi:hypothetical protein
MSQFMGKSIDDLKIFSLLKKSAQPAVFDDSAEGKTRFATSCVLSSSCKVKTCPATKLNMIHTMLLHVCGNMIRSGNSSRKHVSQTLSALVAASLQIQAIGRDLNIAANLFKSSTSLSLNVIDPILVLNS